MLLSLFVLTLKDTSQIAVKIKRTASISGIFISLCLVNTTNFSCSIRRECNIELIIGLLLECRTDSSWFYFTNYDKSPVQKN